MSRSDEPSTSRPGLPNAPGPATAFLSLPEARRRAEWAGVIAVAVSIGLGELLAGSIDGIPSLIVAVGSFVVDATPPWLEDAAISIFGTADKLVLNVMVAVVTLVLGRVVGVQALRRFDRGVVGMGVLGVIGTAAALTQALVSAPLVVIQGVLVTAVGLAALRRMIAAVEDATRDPDHDEPAAARAAIRARSSRREFVGLASGLGVGALLATLFGRSLLTSRGRSGAEGFVLAAPETVALPVIPDAAAFEGIDGLTPIVVPNDAFYRIDTALIVPRVDADTWRLRVHGLVERELTFTLDDLNTTPLIERTVTIACVSNEVGDDLVGNAVWRGVLLRDLLEQAGVRSDAGQVVGRSVDGWTGGFPLAAALDDRDAMVAIGMNGEPLPLAHGFPARLIVPGLYGYVSATKWLTDIELTTWEGFDGYWVPRGWSKCGPIKTQSRIDVPRSGQRLDAGDVVVAGVAWAPTVGIARVEVRLDGGAWVEAELSEPLSEAAWVQWRTALPVPAGQHLIEVRATDATGSTQPSEPVPPRPDGAEGWHTIRITTA